MPVPDRRPLRRRSQSEQVVPTKAALAMTSRAVNANASSTNNMPAPGLITPVLPNSYNEDAARYRKTPLASNTAVMADIIERKNATLPPKPDEAVLAAAAKKARRHVFFSTPTSSMRQSPVLPQDHLTMFPGTGGNVGKHATHEQQMPPPPYTPAGAATGGPYSVGSGRPSFDYACTPACVTARYIPPPPAHLHASQSTVNNVTTIFPSVIAASEALRINLGLDRNQTGLLFNGPPQQPGAPLTMPPQRNSSIPGVPVSHIPFDIASAMSQGGTQGTTTTHAVQYKIFTGMEPLPGMTQPLGCQSSNLPLVVNTGHKGPMKVQPGDWSCLVCSFINWRRRKYCMRCCPFAEGNSNVHSSMLANMAGVQNPLYSSMAAAASRPIYPVYATPPRHVQLRAAPPLLLTAGVSGMAGPNDMLQNQMLHFPMPTAPQMLPGFPALQSPFGPVISTAAQAPYGHSITSHASPDAYASGQAEIDKREGATFLYDSGYGRYPHEHEKHASVQETKIVEIDRPITPSPTGSQSSGCSFAFSSSSAPDADSPTTSIDSNGSTSSASSPETLSKAIRTPPSSKFRGFDDSEKRSEMKHVRLEHSCDDAIEEGLRKLRM